MAGGTGLVSALCRTCESIISTLDYREALDLLVQSVAKALSVKAASIRMLDRTGRVLERVATYGLSKAYLEKGPVEVEKSEIDRLALQGEVIQVRDLASDPRVQYPKEAYEEGIKSALFVPLRYKGRVIGVLRVYTDREHEFSEDEISFVSTLATQGAITIKNAQRYGRLRSISEVGRSIASELDLSRVLSLICENAAKDLSAKGASIMMLDRETGTLEVVAYVGLSEAFIKKGPIAADRSMAECLKGNLVVVEDVATDERVQYPEQAKAEGISSIICVPLRVKQRVIGTLRVYMAYPYKRDEEDMEFLGILGDFGAVAIENARLYQHVKEEYEELARDVWRWYDWGERMPRI